MKCVKWIIGRFCKTPDKDVEEYDAKVEKEVQSHWRNSSLAIKELIRERWVDVSEGALEELQEYNYLVFVDIAGDLDWICGDDHSVKKLSGKASTMIARALSIEAAPCKHLYEPEWMAFKRILGAAIVSALEESYDDAEALMGQACTYLKQRTEERSRKWMLCNSTILMVVFVGVIYWWLNGSVRIPSLFGLLGAYVSIVGHSGVRKTDANAGKPLHWIEAFVRLVVGMILGNIGIHFFNCTLAPELGRTLCSSDAGIRIVAFAAGLIDAFIPSMISTYILLPLNPKGGNHD